MKKNFSIVPKRCILQFVRMHLGNDTLRSCNDFEVGKNVSVGIRFCRL